MITPHAQKSLANARKYFREHLRVGDYYAKDQTVPGEWFGQAADRLGLQGPVGETAFLALCEGRHPTNGRDLTLGASKARNRRIFYDFVFRPPKSVSVVALLCDERLEPLHRAAVHAALHELERFAATRVRRQSECTDRRTGNVVAALFQHETSREQDPLLHTHAVIFNATWDSVEGEWKALQTCDMFRALALAESVYNTELTRELVRLGYGIRQVGKSWEIDGVPPDIVRLFSKRRAQIEQRLAEELARPGNAGLDRHVLRDRIARDERRRKIRSGDRAALVEKWRSQLTATQRDVLARLRPRVARVHLPKPDYAAALAWARAFVFERKSVVHVHELLAAAGRRLLGTDARLSELDAAARRAGVLCGRDPERITSLEGLAREAWIVQRAAERRGRHRPFVAQPDLAVSALDAEQQQAVRTLLRSRDGISLFRGGAGTGKSFALREIVRQIETSGRPVVVASPQAQQARRLADDGISARTLARVLQSAELPTGGVVVIDEAGQVGGRQMQEILQLARRHGCRVILSGDTRQHPAVEASDAMRALEAYAALTTAEIHHIRRQDPARAATAREQAGIVRYRDAVAEAAGGRPEAALARLATAGFVHDTRGADVVGPAAAEFDRLHAAGLDVLAVAQTREVVGALNAAITARLVARGAITAVRPVEVFLPRDVVAAEKQVADAYEPGAWLRFRRAYGRCERGEVAAIVERHERAAVIQFPGGQRRRVSYRYADRWDILDRQEIPLGIGSRVQLRANGKTNDGERLINGQILHVTAIADDGTLTVAADGSTRTLGREQRIVQPGYAVTSYGAQGRTVDAVILADAGVSAATHRKEWYVSISRARRRIAVFTPDVTGLAHRIAATGDRMLGLELVPEVRELVQLGLQAQVRPPAPPAPSAAPRPHFR